MKASAPGFAAALGAFDKSVTPSNPQQQEGVINTVMAEMAIPGDIGAKATVRGTKAATNAVLEKGKALTGRDTDGIIAHRTKELQRLEDSYAPVRKVTSSAMSKGIDTKKILAQTDLLHGAVDTTGTIRTQSAIQELQHFISPYEKAVSQNLEREGVLLPMKTVERSLKTAIDKSGLEGAALETAYGKVDAELAGLARRVDSSGKIKLSKVHDAKINKYSTINYMDEGAKIADKAIAKTYKQLVQEHTKSVAVDALNKELAQHFSVLKLLEKLDGKKVDGGKLGKYFAKTIGAAVGSHFGPLGTIAGAELAGGIKGAAMSTKLSGKTGSGLKASEAMKSATALGKQPRLMLPAGRSGGTYKEVYTARPMGRAFADEKPAQKINRTFSRPDLLQLQAPGKNPIPLGQSNSLGSR
ncbi:hypothetical protein IVB45_02205 [Bradyrhizobium sp. 4]|uniref:hypothetical protein n=1 Tax=Bradyrhizobium sp. 4 TaxID=2782678 RepID=UPI001FFEF09F|nr:hypothetical protein [Bradyrhizobium sp. 4]UPJ35847.1 hypothetical protein IVB45_02205 [Bradyrhizobium sp. 4]